MLNKKKSCKRTCGGKYEHLEFMPVYTVSTGLRETQAPGSLLLEPPDHPSGWQPSVLPDTFYS